MGIDQDGKIDLHKFLSQAQIDRLRTTNQNVTAYYDISVVSAASTTTAATNNTSVATSFTG